MTYDYKFARVRVDVHVDVVRQRFPNHCHHIVNVVVVVVVVVVVATTRALERERM